MEAGAYSLKGKVNPSFTVFGVKFGLTIGGSIASAHVGGGIGSFKDENNWTFVFKGWGIVGLDLGIKFGFQVKKTIK